MLKRFLFIISLGILGFLLLSCNTSPNASTQSDFKLLLTDAPADEATALTVNFGEIRLIASNDEAEENAPVTVSEAGGSFDVLRLQNGTTALLADTTIADGSYSQLRLIVQDATITIDGETKPITIPSGSQSGLKINIEPPLLAEAGQSSQVILDFNANRIVETGNGKYMLGPTAIRATSVSGILQGTIQDSQGKPLTDALVAVTSGSAEALTETKTNEDGSFKIITLTEGSYTIEVSLEGYVSLSLADITITANQETTLTESGVVNLELGVP